MPGIDKARFVGLSDCDAEELKCGICLALFVMDPKVTPCCQQTYCKQCVTKCLKRNSMCPMNCKELLVSQLCKPTPFAVNLINKLRVKCDFHDTGCEVIVPLAHLKRHIANCRYNPDILFCVEC